jgi:hypothetical protein
MGREVVCVALQDETKILESKKRNSTTAGRRTNLPQMVA